MMPVCRLVFCLLIAASPFASTHAQTAPAPKAPQNLRVALSPSIPLPDNWSDLFSKSPTSNANLDQNRITNLAWNGTSRYQATSDIKSLPSYNFGILHLWPLNQASGLDDSAPANNILESTGTPLTFGNVSPSPFADGYAVFTADTRLSAKSIALDPVSALGQGISYGAWIYPTSTANTVVFEQSWTGVSARFTSQRISCTLRESDGTTTWKTQSALLPLNTWSHFICAYDPSTSRFTVYVNGSLSAQTTITTKTGKLYGFADLGVGNTAPAAGASNSTAFLGNITQMVLWGRALSDAEVAALAKDTNRLQPRESSFVSDRISPTNGKSFVDATVKLIEPQGNVQLFVSVGGVNWYPIVSGATLKSTAGLTSQPFFYGFRYKVVLIGDASLAGVDVKFGSVGPTIPNASASLGTNIATFNYYTAGAAFMDLMRGANGTGRGGTTIINNNVDDLPLGTYTFMCEGTGTGWVEANGLKRWSFSCPGRIDLPYTTVNGIKPSWYFAILSESATDQIKNVRLIQPGFLDRYTTEIFTPTFLDPLRSNRILRFMDTLSTNGSPVTTWSSLPSTTPIEYAIEISNRTGIDPWFNVPHQADADFVTQFATFIKQRLDPNRKVYIEYSNEVWNWSFSQTSWLSNWATTQGLTHQQGAASKSLWVTGIFKSVFGANRVVGVLPGWLDSWNSGVLTATKDPKVNPTGLVPDAIATAPYIGNSIGGMALTTSTTIEDIMDMLESTLVDYRARLKGSKALADSFGVTLLGYEAGVHLVNPDNNMYVAEKLMRANRTSSRMNTLLREYYQIWKEEVDTIINHYSYVGEFSKWGSWGASEHLTQPLGLRPKYVALQTMADMDLAARQSKTATCGNGVLEPGEECDGSAFWTTDGTCQNYNPYKFASGRLLCNTSCQATTTSCIPSVCALEKVFLDDNDWRKKPLVGDQVKWVAATLQGQECRGWKVKFELYYSPKGATPILVDSAAVDFYDNQVAMTTRPMVPPNPLPSVTTDMPYVLQATMFSPTGVAVGGVVKDTTWLITK